MSGLDYAGILNAMGRMFGGQNALNPVSSAVNPLSTATSPATASGITDTSAGGVTTLPFDDRINSDLGAGIPSTISSGTSDSLAGADLHTHVNNGEWHETAKLSEKDTYANLHTHVNNGDRHETYTLSEKGTYNSQNQKPEDYNIGTGTRVSKSTTFKGSSDTAGYSSNSKSSQNNIAGLLGAADHFNSNSEKSDQMLIFTPTDLSKSAMSESDYNPLLSDEEIAKAYNSLGKKKRKSVLLLTDGEVKAPHELYEETYPTVLEDTGGNRDLIEKIDKHYQNLLNAPSEEFLSSLQPSVGDIGTGLINFPLTQNNDEDIMKRIRDYYEVIPKDQAASTKPLSGIDVNSSADKESNISTRVRKDNEDFMKQLSSFYEYIPAETNSSETPLAEVVPHLRKEGKTIIDTDEENNNKIVVPRSNEFLPFLTGLKLTESSVGSENEGIMPILLLTDDAESLLRSLNHSKQAKRNSEDIFERMSDFYEFLPVRRNSFDQTPATKIGKTELDKSNENNSERVRKHNNDIIRSMEDFYEFLPNGKDSSDQMAPGNKNDESEVNNPTSKNHERVRKHNNNDIMKIMSDYYELIPVSDIDEIVSSTKMHTSELEKLNENNSERVRKHNNDNIKGMEEFYQFLPIVEDFSEQTAQGTKHDKSGDNNPNSENNERVRKHNNDIMKSMREYYELIPVSDMDQIIPNTKIHKTNKLGKSVENSLGRVRKHNNNIIKGMRDFYEFLPIVNNSSVHGTEIDASKERNPIATSSERVRKHNSDAMNNMSKYYEFIPLNMDSEQTLPSTKVYSHENEKLSENVSGRFRKHNNDIIQSMNNFYEFLPDEMNTSKKSSTGSQTHSTQYIMEKSGDKIISAPNKQGVNEGGTGEHFQSAPRVYRMIPKMVPFIKSGISMHSAVKQHIMDDLKSKFKSNFDLDDKLFVIREGIENSKEYFIAKRRDNIQNGGPWCETCESSHNPCELIRRPCDVSHETCEQSPSKYIFRFTCYDPHSDCPHKKDKNFVLHFDCLNKISPLITNILKNVENHHSNPPDCDKYSIHDHCGTNGISFQNEYSPCPCYSYHRRFDNQYNYNANTADVNTLPPPTANEYGYSSNNLDFKSPTEPVYKKPSEPVYTKPSEPVYTKPSELYYTKPDYTKPTEPDYTKPDYTKPDYTKPTEPDYTKPDYTKPDYTKPTETYYTKPDYTRPSEPDYTKPTETYYTKPDYTKPTEPDYTKPDYTRPSEPDYTKPTETYYTKPDYTKPSEPDYTKPTEPYYTKPDYTRPSEPDYTKPTDPIYTKPSGLPQKNWSEIWEENQSGNYQKSSSDNNNYIIRKSTETDSCLDTYGSNQFSNSFHNTARPISSQSTSELYLNNVSDLPSSETNHQPWNYQSGPCDCSKVPKFEPNNFFQGSPLDWRPHVSSSHSENPETISWPSKQDSNDWSSPPKFHQETQSTADDTLASSNYDRPTEKYDFHRTLPSHPPKPDVTPPVLPCHESSNNYQPLNEPNKSEQVICESKDQTYSKLPEYNGDKGCEKCGGELVGQFIPDFNFSSPISNGRSSIMTISKGDQNKPKYVKDSGVDQYNTFENSKPVIEKRISHAIETIFNTSLQCCKDQETPPCFSGSENTNQPRAPIIKPVCPGNINGGACLDNQCPEPPKCHMKEHVCTKHTQKILKNPDSAKFVQGFECKKIIQSNLCRESIGPCKTPPPPASKECECLADFLEKITQTLDKNGCKENEIKECKCKKE
ncbi:uncharacterized protein LOC111055529 isoform X2 [Nilaparvata lugens]|nr:uncharacterized protein LOC111055529 isoform X2 [Nilaparvata lugens]XP_039288181.1 uncharacterized protein LOC111055529 isoform X2 [Nilaparvata lugens]